MIQEVLSIGKDDFERVMEVEERMGFRHFLGRAGGQRASRVCVD